MPIKEKSFRIGCGRYLQGANILNDVADEISRLGKAPFVVGGSTALELTRKAIEGSINKSLANIAFTSTRARVMMRRRRALRLLHKSAALTLSLAWAAELLWILQSLWLIMPNCR